MVGAGIAGLSAAYEAVRAGAEVTVFDPGPPGGRIRTSDFGGRMVDEGADAWLTRVPQAVELCAELGVGDLVAPAAGRSMLWWDGRLRPLPDGLVLGVPGRVGAIARSGVLSPAGMVRAAADLVLPRRAGADGADVSVYDLVSSRFGSEVASRLVDPLVGGIHAGRTESLSARATVPQLVAAAGRSRSLLRGLRPAPGSGGPVFLAPRGGVSVLVEALVGHLGAAGACFSPSRVRAVEPATGGGVGVDGSHFDAAVVAAPAGEAAAMMGRDAPDAAAGLRSVQYASVVLSTLSWPAGAVEVPAGVNGFLVPRSEGRLTTACSFASSKWPHWSSHGSVVLRVSAGRHLDTRAMDLDEAALADRLVEELGAALGTVLPAPAGVRVSRWPASFPQYGVGHLDRVAGVEAALARELPGVALAGAAYRGAGIPACIGSGRAAARAALVGGS